MFKKFSHDDFITNSICDMKYQASSKSTEYSGLAVWSDLTTTNQNDEYYLHMQDPTMIGSFMFFIQATQIGSSYDPNSLIFN